MDEIFEGRLIRLAAAPSRLGRSPAEPGVRYDYRGESLGLDQYLARNPATGLLIARDDTILVERYQYARNDRHRFTSWSMAKTVTVDADRDRHRRGPHPVGRRSARRRTYRRWRAPSMGAPRSGTCFRCRRACASSRNTRGATTSRCSARDTFMRLADQAASRRSTQFNERAGAERNALLLRVGRDPGAAARA